MCRILPLVKVSLVALIAAANPALAFTNNVKGTSFTVTASVGAGCTVSAPGNQDFGNGTVTAPSDLTTSMGITCTNTTAYAAYFVGANDSGGSRYMVNSSDATQKITYTISSGGTVIGSANNSGQLSGTGTGSLQTTNLTLKITAWNSTPGSYSDTVTLNVDF